MGSISKIKSNVLYKDFIEKLMVKIRDSEIENKAVYLDENSNEHKELLDRVACMLSDKGT
jgi:hypothetical protein